MTNSSNLEQIDLFNSDLNYNAYITGCAEGKTALMRHIASYSTRGYQALIIDLSGSYKRLCDDLGGKRIEIDLSDPISLNPFSVIDEEETLTDLCYALGDCGRSLVDRSSLELEKNAPYEKLIRACLYDAVKQVCKDKGVKAEITDVKLLMKKRDSRPCKEFAKWISPYCDGGEYEKLFKGKSEIDLDARLTVIDPRRLESNLYLRDFIVTALLFESAFANQRTEKRKPLIAVIDEAHRLFNRNPQTDYLIEQAYRRYRKERASIIIATQCFSDIYAEGQLSKVGTAIINNSAWKFFLKQSEKSVDSLIDSEIFGLSEYEESALRSVASKEESGDIFVIDPYNLKTTIPTKSIDGYYRYLTTDNQDDKQMIRELIDGGMSIDEAIRTAIERESINDKRDGKRIGND